MDKKIVYTIEEVLSEIRPFAPRKESRIDFDGDTVPMNSNRYLMFAIKGVTCVSCGFTATYFKKTWGDPNANPHFTPYGIDQNGNERMMTRDHIIPKIEGGSNDVENSQPMCSTCNGNKSAQMDKTLRLLAEKTYGIPVEQIDIEQLEEIVYKQMNPIDVEEFVTKFYENKETLTK